MKKKTLVAVENVSKRFSANGGAREALKGVSLQLCEGEIVSLLGVNGAGKTTLSNIIAGLHPPTSGDVKYLGRSIYEDPVSYRKMIGLCPQKPDLDQALTLEENLMYAGRYRRLPPEEIRMRVSSLIEEFSLQEFAKSKASVLSGGYKQRFLIARTLVHQPKIILLDEPTVGLDPQIRRQLWEQIVLLKEKGSAVLITTHYLDEAESLSDWVCIIDKGSIQTIDTPKNLLAAHGLSRLEDVFLILTAK